MYQTIFECDISRDTTTMSLLMLAFVLASMVLILGLILLFLKDQRKIKKRSVLYYVILLNLLATCIYCMITLPIHDVNITDKYFAGNYDVEEGLVQVVYVDGDTTNYFFVVNETIFSLDGKGGSFSYEYDKQCLENGQYARISYVKYWDENCIMKIEIPIDTQKNNE